MRRSSPFPFALIILAIASVGDVRKIDAFLTGISIRRRQSRTSIATVGPKAEDDNPRRRMSDRRQRQRRASLTRNSPRSDRISRRRRGAPRAIVTEEARTK